MNLIHNKYYCHSFFLLQIYEEEARGDPMITEIIYISSETIDANLDILFETNEDYLNFGIIKMGCETEKNMVLVNKGHYELNYRYVVL